MKKRRGLAALLAAAMCLSAVVPVYADEIAAEPSADVDVVAEVGDVTDDESTMTDINESETENVMINYDMDTNTEENIDPYLSTDEEAFGASIVSSGTCGDQGDNVRWTIDSDGTLTIEGNGKMADYTWGHLSLVYDDYVSKAPFASKASRIKKIDIKEGVTSIGSHTFHSSSGGSNNVKNYKYSALESVSLPSSLKIIGSHAFAENTELQEITVPTGVETIEGGAFFYCTKLNSISLPDTLTSIESAAFDRCSSLTKIEIPDSVTLIGPDAFLQCKSLSSVYLSNNITQIPNECFSNCSALVSINIPEGVTALGRWCFSNCTALVSINIPATVTDIGSNVFINCDALTHVHIPYGTTYLDYKTRGELPVSEECYIVQSIDGHCPSVDCPLGLSLNVEALDEITLGGVINTHLSIPTLEPMPYEYNGVTYSIVGFKCYDSTANDYDIRDYHGMKVVVTGYAVPDGYGHLIIQNDQPNFTIRATELETHTADLSLLTGDTKLIDLRTYSQLPKFSTKAKMSYYVSDESIISIERYSEEIQLGSGSPHVKYPVISANRAGEAVLSADVIDGSNCFTAKLHITVAPSADMKLQVTSERYGDKELPITFSNELFTRDTTVFDHEFSKMSSVMAMAAYVGKGETDHCRGNLEKLGFSNFETYGSYEKTWDGLTPDDDHYVAYTFARKDIKTSDGKKTIIAVMVKGTSKNDEWYSDFDINKNASSEGGFDHYGFKTAGDRLLVDYNKYLDSMSDLDRSNMKVWITGHSRGASVGNYIAAKITDQLSTQNVVAYVYACPNVTKAPDVMLTGKYDNIFNFNNPEDLVPCLPLRKWGYSRYGRTYIFPSNAENKANMVKEADDMAESLWGDTISDNHWSDRFATVNSIVEFMYNDFDSVNEYYNKGALNLDFLYDEIDGMPCDEQIKFVLNGLGLDRISMYQFIHHIVATALGDENWDDAKWMFVKDIPSMILRPKNDDAQFVHNIAGFMLDNGLRAMPAFTYGHMPEVYVTWTYTLSSVDQYEDMGKSYCKYKRYAVECPVDIEIYDDSNNIIGRVVDNKVDESVTKIGIIVFDESKYFYYPADEKITIKAKGYDNGTMDFTTALVDISDHSSKDERSVEKINITPNTVVKIEEKKDPQNTGNEDIEDIVITATTKTNSAEKTIEYTVHPDNTIEKEETDIVLAPAKPTTIVKTAFGGRTVQLNCADTDAEIYYQFGSSNITTACEHVKAGETIFLDEPMTGNRAAMYFKAYKDGKWSVLGKWGVLNVQIAKPLITPSGKASENNFKVYTQTKDSYIIYTLDGSVPAINEGTQKLAVKNGRIVWGTTAVVKVPEGRTIKAIAVRCGLVTSDVMTYTNR